ncbi:glycosyltransferase family protein [Paeniroseomonas aquatica]
MVRAAAEAGVGLQVHGGGWAALLPESIVKSQLIQNDELGDLYRGARVVLNDHWEDMRRWEIVSNRIFDAVACGRPVISDDCEGIASYFRDTVVTHRQGRAFWIHSPVRPVPRYQRMYCVPRRSMCLQSILLPNERSSWIVSFGN